MLLLYFILIYFFKVCFLLYQILAIINNSKNIIKADSLILVILGVNFINSVYIFI